MTRRSSTGHRLAPTRRAAMGGLIAAAALPGMTRRASAADADVAIIGAGAAGISAARELQRIGRSFVLIEARDRIGGRAFTDASLGHGFDAGAQIIHFAPDNPWVAIARELGVALDESGGRMGGWQVFSGGRPLGPLERGRRWQAFRAMEAAMVEVAASGRDMSLAEAVAGLPADQREIARSGLLLVLGEDGERISVLDNQQLWSGPDYTTQDGYGALVAAYGRGLPVSLSTPASHVRWGEGGVTVETPAGAIRARSAIITVPVGVLQADAIRFTPELPDSYRAALGGIGMGALTKIAVRLDGDRFGFSDETVLMESTRSPAMTMIEMYPDGKPLAVAICGGDFARGLGAAGEAAAVAQVTDMLAGMLGGAVRAQVRGGRLASWWADPLSRGAYSVCAPGHAAARAALAAPVGDRLWFAGEATAGGASMTVGGATLSARKAVGEIAARLRS